ncbi:MAG: ribosomal protein L11 methyltransferase [Cryomorphaceae bacterium]|jgi:ribosomal protein L11 methyltransferase
MNYFVYRFTCDPAKPTTEILISQLAGLDFESFIDNETGTDAYVPADGESEEKVQELIDGLEGTVSYEREEIPEQNWNAQWEADYEPVCVEKKFRVRAPFHEIDASFEHDILIQPQMSFGTGHHETTWLMLNEMETIQWKDNSVLDAGSGTAVLAIAARKLGADRILAYDIEEWAYQNTLTNIALNNMEMEILKGDVSVIGDSSFGVILANINKNVLLNDIPHFAKALKPGGYLLLSGFFITDVDDLVARANENHLSKESVKTKNDWALLKLKKA